MLPTTPIKHIMISVAKVSNYSHDKYFIIIYIFIRIYLRILNAAVTKNLLFDFCSEVNDSIISFDNYKQLIGYKAFDKY